MCDSFKPRNETLQNSRNKKQNKLEAVKTKQEQIVEHKKNLKFRKTKEQLPKYINIWAVGLLIS